VRDAFGHLKAIGVDKGGQALLKIVNAGQDAGVVDTNDKGAFIAAAKTRQWDREKSVRTLASPPVSMLLNKNKVSYENPNCSYFP
jgi:catalase